MVINHFLALALLAAQPRSPIIDTDAGSDSRFRKLFLEAFKK